MSKGGNLGGNGSITVSGDTVIRDGYATVTAGNWSIFNNEKCTISGGTISGNTARTNGGAVSSVRNNRGRK